MFLLSGFGLGMVYTPAYIIIVAYFDARRGLALGLMTSGSAVGSFAGAPLLHYLFVEYGYQGGFLVIGAFCLHCCVGGALFCPRDIHDVIQNGEELVVEADQGVSEEKPCDSTDREAMERRDNGEKTIAYRYDCELQKTESNPDVNCDMIERHSTETTNPDDTRTTTATQESTPCLPETKKGRESTIVTNDNTAVTQTDQKKKPGRKLLDCSLFSEPLFLMFLLVYVCATSSFSVTIMFVPALAIDLGVAEKEMAYFLLSIIGIVDGFVRIPAGIIIDLPRVRPYRVMGYFLFTVLNGVGTLLMPLSLNYASFAILAGLRGIGTSIFMPQRMTVLADMFGATRSPSAFGVLLLGGVLGGIGARTLGGKCIE